MLALLKFSLSLFDEEQYWSLAKGQARYRQTNSKQSSRWSSSRLEAADIGTLLEDGPVLLAASNEVLSVHAKVLCQKGEQDGRLYNKHLLSLA